MHTQGVMKNRRQIRCAMTLLVKAGKDADWMARGDRTGKESCLPVRTA